MYSVGGLGAPHLHEPSQYLKPEELLLYSPAFVVDGFEITSIHQHKEKRRERKRKRGEWEKQGWKEGEGERGGGRKGEKKKGREGGREMEMKRDWGEGKKEVQVESIDGR